MSTKTTHSVEPPSISLNLPTRARRLLKQFYAQFPVFAETKPLAIGIDKQLIAAIPDIDRRVLRLALSMHTGSSQYLRSMGRSDKRFNLDGTPATEVQPAHQKRAQQLLVERIQKEKDRESAAQLAKDQAEIERRKTEKLSKLLAKYARR